MLKATSRNQWMGITGSHGGAKVRSTCQPKDADPSHGTSDYHQSMKMMQM